MLIPAQQSVAVAAVLVVLELEHHCLLRLAQNIRLPLELVAQVLHLVKALVDLTQYLVVLLLLEVVRVDAN
jgi:hypothetical protein